MTLIFATANPHKAREIEHILDGKFEVKTMREIGQLDDIEETEPTIEGNARLKARFLHEKFDVNCFSEDTGLEVESLGGEPGVHTARYAGDDRSPEKNMEKLLRELAGKPNRTARFRTVIWLILNGEEHEFEGNCPGKIALEKRGEKGWGYDPVFIPDGHNLTFAELGEEVKNRISHRALATEKFMNFLLTQ